MPEFQSLSPEDQDFYRTELQKQQDRAQRAAEKARRKEEAAATKERTKQQKALELRAQEEERAAALQRQQERQQQPTPPRIEPAPIGMPEQRLPPPGRAMRSKPKSSGIGCGGWALIAMGVMAMLLLVVCSGSTGGRRRSRTPALSQSWYSGGTLHKATMREWSQASYKNKLATASDFVCKKVQIDGRTMPPVDSLRPAAEHLVRNLDAANAGGAANDQEVTTVVAMLWVMEEY